ncbi:hypothetical protein M2272_005863 [Mycobacterium frederiksbergense]|uniref:Terminase small subunit n=1 Tax=Mycolicibacterium frederiksbergense TaxID=117567 RepID=A0ABT6L9Z3_9MYCO|nr:hypothetical protein [Mycolicibacterium frederiksbergense]MDH6199195.1 hypothetical protein [Mycolicibacterium frederiksbergense]
MTAKAPANSGADPANSEATTAGQRLMAELARESDPYPLTLMIIEACRMADRLEQFDALLSGKQDAWMRLRVRDEVVEVQVDKVLQEARQCATVFRHYLADIHRQRAGISTGPDDDSDPLDKF